MTVQDARGSLARYLAVGVELGTDGDVLVVDVPPDVSPELLPPRSHSLDAEVLALLGDALHPAGTTVMPLSWTQQRMLFSSHQEGARSNTTVPHALRLRGPLRVAALHEALRRLLAHHPMLRASIITVADLTLQRIAPSAEVGLPVTDLTAVPAAEREAEALRLAREEMSRPFDLAVAPLIRPSLLRLAEEDHVLLLPVHHQVTDGLSLPLINRTLLAAYQEVVDGMPPSQAAPRSTYRRFIAEQFSARATTEGVRHHAYWLERLRDKPPLLNLPTDRPRPAVPSFRGRPVEHSLPADLNSALEAFARKQHVTPFMLYSAAVHMLLARWSGQNDVTLGYPFANRLSREQTEVVGLHITTLLQRIQLADDPTVVDLVARVRREVLAGTGHHRLRFDRLVSDLGVPRSTAHHPVFQVLIGYNGKAQPLQEVVGLHPELYIVDTGSARFDLEFYLRPDGDDMVVMLWAQDDLFDVATVRRMLRHLQRLLEGMLAEPELPVSRLPLMDDDETVEAIAAGTGPEITGPRSSVPEQIVDTAAAHPQRCAVRFGDAALTYGELDARSAAVATRLRARGVGTDDVVGVHLDRSLELLVLLVGILRAGAAYLPLDPALPEERIAAMVEDARPVLVVSEDDLAALTAEGPAGALPDLPPSSLAYVIFTSGSTGRPKGVMNTHEALENRLRWMQEAYPIDDRDVVLHKTPLSFDVSVWELFWPLTVGATLVVAAPGGHRDPDYLGELIQTERVTVVHFVPSMLRAFLAAGELAGCTTLRHLVCSGEALTPELRDAVLASSSAQLHNLYGPTEAAIDVTAEDLAPESVHRDVVPIGRPITGIQVHVLDAAGAAVPPGVVGELYIGGVGLARGYAGRPALTAQRFVPSPISPGERLYRTGDLGRRLADGRIEYLGRNDDQVKLRGFRIELGEIEAAINGVDGVSQSVVVLWDDGSGTTALAAYLTCEHPDVLDDVRNALTRRLPEYMVPRLWTLLDELPLLPSGKVDRTRLPRPHQPVATASDQSWTATERLIGDVWQATLGTRPATPMDDFFLSGGDSIRSIELVVAARARGLALTVEKIFQNPTPRGLAAVAVPHDAAEQADDGPFCLVPAHTRQLLPTGVQDAFPLSRLLSGLFYESRTNPDYRVYTTSLRLRGEFDEPRLRHAVRLLLDRHPFLRSSVDLDTFGQAVQLVHRNVPDPLSVVDLRPLGTVGQSAFDEWFHAERNRRFDWAAPPLLALTAHRMTDDEFQLTLTEPFLDGWSVTLAMNELLTYYRESSGSSGPEVQVQAEFLRQEERALADPGARDHWRRVLADPPPGKLPGAEKPGYEVRTVDIAEKVSRRLLELADALAVPVKSVLLAAHVQVVALLTGSCDVLTGLMANSRPETVDGAAAVGMFLNTTPIRVDVDLGSGRELVTAVHSTEADALAHRAYPYAQMLRDSGIASPLRTTFNYTHFRPYRDLADDSRLTLMSLRATDQTYHPLTAQFRQDVLSGEIGLFLEFSDAGLTDEQMNQITGYYGEALRRLAEAPDEPITPLDRLMPDVTPAVADAAAPISGENLFARFAAQATRTPDAPALRHRGKSVTYAELAVAARALSARLSAHDVGPGSVVPLCLERSLAYVAAVLAVLRLGAAYAPVDPAQPLLRRHDLLTAVGSHVVLTGPADEEPLPQGQTRIAVTFDVVADEVPVDVQTDSEAAAVVVFTSGSTGAPKGVVLSHAAVANRLNWSAIHEPAQPDDVFLLRTPIGFVDSVAELFDGLLRGVTTEILPDEVRDPAEIVSAMAQARITKVTMVPALLAEILRLGDLRGLESVRCWHLSGEPLRGELVRALLRKLPHVTVYNLYGSTEVCADATVHLVSADEPALVPVGLPLPGLTTYVLHPGGGLVPDGIAGELAIGGRGLATGYFADPVATARRFVPAPRGVERIYRTGDLAVRTEDGTITLLGRVDRQIKVRGVRVEPAEVEAALTSHPDVTEALVRQVSRDTGDVLAGYVRTRGAAVGVRDLRAFLLKRLPSAAVPDVLVTVDDWPRLSSGKIDQSALPAPEAPRRTTARPPTGLLENELAALWQQRLGTAPEDVADDFFELGGHSLHAIVLAAALRRDMGVAVQVSDIFDHPTLSEQAGLLERLLTASVKD
ncbi:amino acid adenylation domain-containing protein [Lentzea sp. NPDC004789]